MITPTATIPARKPRQRKTRDEYQIHQLCYGQWAEVCAAETRRESVQLRREYRENQPEYPVKIIKRRIKID